MQYNTLQLKRERYHDTIGGIDKNEDKIGIITTLRYQRQHSNEKGGMIVKPLGI